MTALAPAALSGLKFAGIDMSPSLQVVGRSAILYLLLEDY
jgi:hypothetical protein